MAYHLKIRALRELNNWSQEEMADKMNLSKNGYAKIERGESKMSLERLQQIAEIFNINIMELIDGGHNSILSFIGDNSQFIHNSSDVLAAENEKLKLLLKHRDELLQSKESENQILKDLVLSLKSQLSEK